MDNNDAIRIYQYLEFPIVNAYRYHTSHDLVIESRVLTSFDVSLKAGLVPSSEMQSQQKRSNTPPSGSRSYMYC